MTTRAQLRTDALDIADANGSDRWDDSAGGEVDRRLSFVHLREWRRLLDTAPYARTAKRTPTMDSEGKVTLASLSTLTGDSQEHLYRIQIVAFSGREYDDGTQFGKDFFLAQTYGRTGYRYYRDMTYLWAPDAANLTADGVWVNHLPTPFHQLSDDTADVALPFGYDDIFAYEAAAALLMKGAEETKAALELRQWAQEMRDEFLSSYARITSAPLQFRAPDSASDWGG